MVPSMRASREQSAEHYHMINCNKQPPSKLRRTKNKWNINCCSLHSPRHHLGLIGDLLKLEQLYSYYLVNNLVLSFVIVTVTCFNPMNFQQNILHNFLFRRLFVFLLAFIVILWISRRLFISLRSSKKTASTLCLVLADVST